MPRKSAHVRCPHCQGLNTKRHGILAFRRITLQGVHLKGTQRWFCKECRRAFTPEPYRCVQAKYDLEINEKAVMLYFDEAASYRAVGRELSRLCSHRISGKRAFYLIQPLLQNCKSPLEVSLELCPQWSGFVIVDGDSLRVGKSRLSLLVGVDALTQDIPHAILADHEDMENWLHFLLVLRYEVHFPFKGVVSDGDPAIESAMELVCPGVPYQLCIKHFQDGLVRYLRYQSSHGRGTWREIDRFLEAVHHCLYAQTLEESCAFRDAISIDPGFKKIHLEDAISKLQTNFVRLTQHFRVPGLPRTTNIAEGTIRRLDRKLNTTDGFEVQESAWNTIKMLLVHYRFRAFTDSRTRENNGLCPLQLAEIDTRNVNWIKFSQRSKDLRQQ